LSDRYCYLPLLWKSWNWFECGVGILLFCFGTVADACQGNFRVTYVLFAVLLARGYHVTGESCHLFYLRIKHRHPEFSVISFAEIINA